MANGHGTQGLPGLDDFCRPEHKNQNGARFGRLFEDLDPLWIDPDVLNALGAPGGPLATSTPPARTISVPAGMIFFGQFIDHDITLDVTSSLDRVSMASDIPNDRTPTLDLDCVYGAGPEAARFMFDGARVITADRLGKDGYEADDVPRVNGVALIGDFRNDENRIVSQLQLGMIRYHNRIVDVFEKEARDVGRTIETGELFEEARRHCTWHYQRTIVTEFLPTLCGKTAVERVLAHGPLFYRPTTPFIPVEFSAAAYRFGHSMVPQQLQVQDGEPAHDLFGEELGFGFSPVPNAQAVVDWKHLLQVGSAPAPQMSHRCGPMLADGLLRLSASVDSAGRSLAALNMLRGQALLLPSGEAVAKAMGIDAAQVATVSDAAREQAGGLLAGATPLWFWILNEADVIGRETTPGSFEPGEGLGPVGATIVAEVLIGLMSRDPRSWLSANRNFHPENGQRTIAELLTHATEVDVTTGTRLAEIAGQDQVSKR